MKSKDDGVNNDQITTESIFIELLLGKYTNLTPEVRNEMFIL